MLFCKVLNRATDKAELVQGDRMADRLPRKNNQWVFVSTIKELLIRQQI